ncbi:hypothetical protein [Metabacillus schmidteae]|uniref:hypothetical protein n=1 Tax=Metabacillus schmidteae TaxID=2730405 RepID=UPI001588BFE6|nr:hypothetical protein [Metabacillus schmidteae]
MNREIYFNSKNYTGDHLHVGNWNDESKPLIEGIAWVRQDGSMDLFFNEFETDHEIHELFHNHGYYYETFKGGYICTVNTDEEAYETFQKWVEGVLYSYRMIDKPSSEEVE